MIRCRTILAACAAVLIAPTAAAAQLIVIDSNGPPVKETAIPVRITGVLSVQFRGEPSDGCARWGLCGYSGTVSWQPPPTASIRIDQTGGRHPHLAVVVFPTLTGTQFASGATTASVALAAGSSSGPASHCVDATSEGQGASLLVRHGRATFSLAGESSTLLLTRCAGPRDGDVVSHLPTPSIPVQMLERGNTTISLSASRPLESHGLAGLITSTIMLRLGQPGRPRLEDDDGSEGPTKPGREIDVTYRATLSGTVVEQIRGAANPLECGPLDSCGLAGTITLSPQVHATVANLVVDAKATTPRRELLAAAGLRRGSAGGVTGVGVGWRGGGSVISDLSQGLERCRDTTSFGLGALTFITSRGSWQVSTLSGSFIGVPGTSTRCPGPILSNDGAIGSHTAPLSSLDRRTARIALTRGSTVTDDGYRVRIVPDLTLTLTRVRVRTKAIRSLTGLFGGS
jgi:hypothetical protein